MSPQPPQPAPPEPPSPRQVEELFNQVADLPDPDRESILRACPSPALVREVRLLLAELNTDISLAIDRAAALVETDAPAPTRIGEFRILGILGEGGMGRVYEAEQDSPRRRVALKVIRAGVLSRSVLRRFNHEAHVLGQLKHPGIAQVFQAGIARAEGIDDPAALDGPPHLPYFAMELVRGPTLTAFTRQHNLSRRAKLLLLAQVCDAVHHAHQRGVIHRDLKPANILVEGGPDEGAALQPGAPAHSHASFSDADRPFSPKILDFGIARLADSESESRPTLDTHAGQIVGTLGYMSPEQVEGDQSRLDIRSDIYSLGVIGYELLAGKLPLDVSGKSVAAAVTLIRQTEPPRLSVLDPALRGDIETIIAKAIDKERDRRYASAAELAADIRRHLRDEPIAARPAGTLYHLRKFARRNRPLVLAAALLALGITAAAVTSTLFALRESSARARADAALRRANLAAAMSDAAAGNAASARNRLAAVAPADRGWEWRYLDHLCHRFADQVLVSEPSLVIPIPGFSSLASDADRAAAAPPDVLMVPVAGGLLSRRAAHAQPQPLFTLAGPVQSLVCTPDARAILTLTAGELALRDFGTGSPRWSLAGVRPLGATPFSADARRLVVHADPDQLLVLDAASGNIARRFSIPTAEDLAPRFDRIRLAPDAPARECITVNTPIGTDFLDPDTGSRLRTVPLLLGRVLDDQHTIFGDRTSAMASFDLFTGAQRTIGPLGYYRSSAADPTGAWLVTQDYSSSIRVTDPATSNLLYRLHGPGPGITALTVASGGRWLLSNNGREVHWWDMQAGPSPSAVPATSTEAAISACISHDGDRVAVLGWGNVRVWDTRAGRNIWSAVPARTPWSAQGAFSPDDHAIAIAGWEGLITVLDAATGAPRWSVATGRDQPLPTAVLWSAAADRLVVGDAAGHLRSLDAASGATLGAPDASLSRRILALTVHAPDSILALTDDGIIHVFPADHPERATEFARLERTGELGGLLVPSPAGGLLLASTGVADARLFDLRTGRELIRWPSLGGGVLGADFSPDGSRLAMVCYDGLTRIHETRSGEELLALGSPGGLALTVALTVDRLIVSDSHSAVTIYDAAPDPADSSAWHATQAARAIIDPLFESLSHSQRVIDHLAAHPPSPTAAHPDLPGLCLELARARGDALNQFNSLAWGIVRFPGQSPDALARAIDDAELCRRAKPDNWAYANTLGVAYYRAARYADAIAALTDSETLARVVDRPVEPLNTIFIALSHHHLGHADDAARWWKTTLALITDPASITEPELRSALGEALAVFPSK